jgi:hypothetical protein
MEQKGTEGTKSGEWSDAEISRAVGKLLTAKNPGASWPTGPLVQTLCRTQAEAAVVYAC